MRRSVGWPRRAILIVVLALPATAVVARAEPPAAPGIGFAGKRPPAEDGKKWGDGRTSRGPEPIAEPARGSPYNLTHIAYASAIMLAMLALVLWLVRRARRERT